MHLACLSFLASPKELQSKGVTVSNQLKDLSETITCEVTKQDQKVWFGGPTCSPRHTACHWEGAVPGSMETRAHSLSPPRSSSHTAQVSDLTTCPLTLMPNFAMPMEVQVPTEPVCDLPLSIARSGQ